MKNSYICPHSMIYFLGIKKLKLIISSFLLQRANIIFIWLKIPILGLIWSDIPGSIHYKHKIYINIQLQINRTHMVLSASSCTVCSSPDSIEVLRLVRVSCPASLETSMACCDEFTSVKQWWYKGLFFIKPICTLGLWEHLINICTINF